MPSNSETDDQILSDAAPARTETKTVCTYGYILFKHGISIYVHSPLGHLYIQLDTLRLHTGFYKLNGDAYFGNRS